MKTIIAGSRDITDYDVVAKAIKQSGFKITEIVSGGARGVDKLGEKYARLHNYPCSFFPAQWDKYSKSAGYKRNAEMAEYADALIAVWDGTSPGTSHVIKLAKKLGLKVFVKIVEL